MGCLLTWAQPRPTCLLSPVSFGILSKGLRLLTPLPTANIIYLLNVLAGKPNFYISRTAKIWRPVNFRHDLIRVILLFCSVKASSVLCSTLSPALLSAQTSPDTPPPPTCLPLQPSPKTPSFGVPSSVPLWSVSPSYSLRLFTEYLMPLLKLDLSKDTTFLHGPLTILSGNFQCLSPPSWESLIF